MPVGGAGVHLNDRFLIARNADGDILLTPVVGIPKRELLFLEHSAVRETVLAGLRDLQEGNALALDGLLDDIDGE